MELFSPWQEMHETKSQEQKESNNKARNRIIAEIFLSNKERLLFLATFSAIILLIPSASMAAEKFLKKEKKIGAWKSYFSLEEWYQYAKEKKFSSGFTKYAIPASLILGTGTVTYLYTSGKYIKIIEELIKVQNLNCERQLFDSNAIFEVSMLEKANLFTKRFIKSNLSWSDIVLKKDLDLENCFFLLNEKSK